VRTPVKGFWLDSVIDWAKEVSAKEILSGRLIEGVAVTTSNVAKEHALDRIPRGVVIVASDVAQGYKRSNFTKTHYTISAASAATVSLWVF
jgi:hypothetical protein